MRKQMIEDRKNLKAERAKTVKLESLDQVVDRLSEVE